MMRIYLIGGFIAALVLGIWYHIQVAEENARLEYSLSQAGETIALMEQDRKNKEATNTQLRQRQEELAHEKARLEHDLEQFPRTEAQRDCDLANTPNGYSRRMLQFARDQGKVLEARPDVGAGDAPVSGSEESGDLRPSQEQSPDGSPESVGEL